MTIADKLTYLDETKSQLLEAINAVASSGLDGSSTFRSYPDALWEHYITNTIFGGGEQGAWYDPSDLSTLFQDSAGTTPVTADGDPVGLMLDKSGNDNHATQTTSASRPVYRTDGTLHWLEFDGVDDYFVFPTTDAQSLFISGAFTSNNESVIPIITNTGTETLGSRHIFLRRQDDYTASVDGDAAQTGGIAINGGILFPEDLSGTNISYPDFPTEYPTGDTVFTAILNTIYSFNNIGYLLTGSSSYFLGNKIYGIVLVNDNKRVVRTQAEGYMAAKAGVTL